MKAHREARDDHAEQGNDDLAEAHHEASRYHQRAAYHAGKRAARNVLNMANSASRRAARSGSVQAHSDAAHVNRVASATAQIAGDHSMAQMYATTARQHEMKIADMRAARSSLVQNIGPSGAGLPIYLGQGVVPPEAAAYYGPGLTVNVASTPGGPDDYLPMP